MCTAADIKPTFCMVHLVKGGMLLFALPACLQDSKRGMLCNRNTHTHS